MADERIQDESIEQVEADMRMLEELLQKNRFKSSFGNLRDTAEDAPESAPVIEGEKSYGRLLSIINDSGEDGGVEEREADDGTGGSDVLEKSPGAPVEVTDLLYGASGSGGSSLEGEDLEAYDRELTLRDLALQEESDGRGHRGAHRIPSKAKGDSPPSDEGAEEADDAQAAKQKKKKKKKVGKRPEDLVPTMYTRAPRKRHSMANVLERVSAEQMEELTFRPKLAWGGAGDAPSSSGGVVRSQRGTSASSKRGDERIRKLARPMTDKWTQRELDKLREEMAEASKFSFHPNISERSVQLATTKQKKKKPGQDRQGEAFLAEDDPWEDREREGGSASDSRHERPEPIEVRLMRSNEEKQAHLRQAKLEKECADLMHCTFKPNIEKKPAFLAEDYKPIHERLHKVLQEKSLRLASMRMNAELEDPDLTFQPKINSKSARLAHMKQVREELSTIDRLASGMVTTAAAAAGPRDQAKSKPRPKSASSAGAKRGGELAAAFAESEAYYLGKTPLRGEAEGVSGDKPPSSLSEDREGPLDISKVVPRECLDCTFSPQINKKSKEILRKSRVFHPDFHKRQERFVEHRERLINKGKRTEDPDCTFTPNIGNARDFLKHQSNKNLAETRLEAVTRLSSRDLEEKRVKERSLREAHYAQYKFEPQLSERTRRVGRPTDLHELVYNERGERIRRGIAKEVEEEFNSKCTFRPNLVSRHHHGDHHGSHASGGHGGHGGGRGSKENVIPCSALHIAGDAETVIQRIETYRQEKELRMRESREEAEASRMRQCTFAPRVNREGAARAKLNKPVVVHGLTRFLQNREMARQKEEDKRRREMEVFAGHQGNGGSAKHRSCFTVAEPFKLSQSRTASEKMARLRKELENDFREKCTFQPKLRRF